MIQSFANQLAEDIYFDRSSKEVRAFSPQLRRAVRRKLLYLHDAVGLDDLRVPPGNRLEALKGQYRGFFCVRINDQWRLLFRWVDGHCHEVQITDYH